MNQLGESFFFYAESGGFEPPVQYNPYDSLANCWFQPLTQLSNPCWHLKKIDFSNQDVANISQLKRFLQGQLHKQLQELTKIE